MFFQRRHYEFLAGVLKGSNAKDSAAWDQIVNEITEALAKENPHFLPTRFKLSSGKCQRTSEGILNNVVNLRPTSKIGGLGYNG